MPILCYYDVTKESVMIIAEDQDTVTVRVSPESMDAHIQCLKENGYSVKKKSYFVLSTIIHILFGMFVALSAVKYGW